MHQAPLTSDEAKFSPLPRGLQASEEYLLIQLMQRVEEDGRRERGCARWSIGNYLSALEEICGCTVKQKEELSAVEL